MAESLTMEMKLAISGAKESQQQLSAATTSVKQMQSALKLADSEFKLSGDAAAMYTSKIQTLQAQIAAQTKAVEAAKSGLEKISGAFGESSSRAMAWQAKVNNAQTALNNMQASMNDMTAKLSESSAAMSSTAGAAGNLASALSGMSGGSYSMDGLNSSLGASQAEIAKTSDQIKELQAQVKETGGLFYNVGNMSISAANGGKMASVITGISKELTNIVKSSSETAENTGGLLNGGSVSVGGVLTTVGSIASNFGPWGQIAGAVLQMGGAIADSITAAQKEAEQRAAYDRREQMMSAFSNSEYDRRLAEAIGNLYNRSKETYTAEVSANIQAEVTAKVDGLRVVIEEATEDGKVNKKDVGTVKRYVEEVLMADYDDAVEELYRMRGELYKIATMGFSSDEVALYGVRTGDPEQSALFLLFKETLGDRTKIGTELANKIGPDVENVATQMWLYLSKAFGSTEAMMAAFHDPAQQNQMMRVLQSFLNAQYGLSFNDTLAFATDFLRTIRGMSTEIFSGTSMTVGEDWLSTTEGGGILVAWVQSMLTDADKGKALDYCTDMWLEVMAACSSPTDAANAIWHNTGEEAAAAYMAGEDSATSQTFGVMVEWVKKNLNVKDHAEAIRIATQMWNETRRAASYGSMTATTGVTVDTSWITDSSAGNIFTDWVAANLTEGDKDKAVETATGMWAEVVAAASSPEGAMGSILASSGDEVRDAYESGEKSTRTQTFGTMLAWVKANLSPKDEAQALKWAVDMWNEVRNAASYGNPNGTRITVDSSWITETQAGSIFSDYVASILDDDDKDAAVEKAKGMWTEVVAAASSPEAAIGAMAGSSGEEAAAAAEAGEDSDTANSFNAMVAWVMKTMSVDDRNEAVKVAISMWDTIRKAAFLGIDMDGVDHTAPLTVEKSWAASTAMSEYISARMGTDFEAAIAQANKWWDDLVAAVEGKTSATPETALRASLLEQAMAEYKSTMDEITATTASMAGLQGRDLDEKIAQLEALMERAEALAGRIEKLQGSEEMIQGQGAYNMVLSGIGGEEEIANAFAYLTMLDQMSQDNWKQAKADAKVARYMAYGSADYAEGRITAEQIEAEYAAALATADAKWWENQHQYDAQVNALINSILENGMMGYTYTGATEQYEYVGPDGKSTMVPVVPAEVTQIVWGLIAKGMLEGANTSTFENAMGPFRDALLGIMLDLPNQGAYEGSTVTRGLVGIPWLTAQGYEPSSGMDVIIEGKQYDDEAHLPLSPGILSALYTMFSSSFGADLRDIRNEFYQTSEGSSASKDTLLNIYRWAGLVTDIPVPSEFDDTDATAAMEETGENLDNTLAAAIAANAGGPIAAAAGMATAIVNTIKSVLDIRSPSHVMQAFGEYTAEGLAEGIDANIAMVARASGRMAQTVARPVGAVAGAAGNTVNNTATSSLYIDKYYQRSDADIDYLAAAIADKNRLGRMGNGLRT